MTRITIGKPKVGVIFDEEMLLHKLYKEYHPERPERAMAIYLNLVKKGIYQELVRLDFGPAEEKHLEYVHPSTHVQKVKDTIYSVNLKNHKQPKRRKRRKVLGSQLVDSRTDTI